MPGHDSSGSQVELDAIRSRYARRNAIPRWKQAYYRRAQRDRQKIYAHLLQHRFASFQDVRMLEVGAGAGVNLNFFHELGIPWSSIHANELLDERVAQLRDRFPEELTVLPGNALEVQESYDLILVSTVFSSILDRSFREELASHLLNLLTSRGCIVWYDFIYNNPRNPDVRGVSSRELRSLFSAASSIQCQSTTLAPPVAMLAGPTYGLFNMLPFLRSHVVALISG